MAVTATVWAPGAGKYFLSVLPEKAFAEPARGEVSCLAPDPMGMPPCKWVPALVKPTADRGPGRETQAAADWLPPSDTLWDDKCCSLFSTLKFGIISCSGKLVEAQVGRGSVSMLGKKMH